MWTMNMISINPYIFIFIFMWRPQMSIYVPCTGEQEGESERRNRLVSNRKGGGERRMYLYKKHNCENWNRRQIYWKIAREVRETSLTTLYVSTIFLLYFRTRGTTNLLSINEGINLPTEYFSKRIYAASYYKSSCVYLKGFLFFVMCCPMASLSWFDLMCYLQNLKPSLGKCFAWLAADWL